MKATTRDHLVEVLLPYPMHQPCETLGPPRQKRHQIPTIPQGHMSRASDWTQEPFRLRLHRRLQFGRLPCSSKPSQNSQNSLRTQRAPITRLNQFTRLYQARQFDQCLNNGGRQSRICDRSIKITPLFLLHQLQVLLLPQQRKALSVAPSPSRNQSRTLGNSNGNLPKTNIRTTNNYLTMLLGSKRRLLAWLGKMTMIRVSEGY